MPSLTRWLGRITGKQQVVFLPTITGPLVAPDANISVNISYQKGLQVMNEDVRNALKHVLTEFAMTTYPDEQTHIQLYTTQPPTQPGAQQARVYGYDDHAKECWWLALIICPSRSMSPVPVRVCLNDKLETTVRPHPGNSGAFAYFWQTP